MYTEVTLQYHMYAHLALCTLRVCVCERECVYKQEIECLQVKKEKKLSVFKIIDLPHTPRGGKKMQLEVSLIRWSRENKFPLQGQQSNSRFPACLGWLLQLISQFSGVLTRHSSKAAYIHVPTQAVIHIHIYTLYIVYNTCVWSDRKDRGCTTRGVPSDVWGS